MLYGTADKKKVYVKPEGHLKQHEDVLPLLEEAISKVKFYDLPEGVSVIDVDLGRRVGATICVETTPDDEIVFAQRVGRNGPSRFVLGKKPVATSNVAIVIKREQNRARVLSSWIGKKAPMEPWDKNIRTDEERKQSEEFWATHALVYGHQKIIK